MKTLLLSAAICMVCFASCKKGLIFDKEMVIGDWRMWEQYSLGNTYYWTFTRDSLFIYLKPDSLDIDVKQNPSCLVYKQGTWNNHSFTIDIFDASNPFDSSRTFSCYIDIAKYHRDYLVLRESKSNWSASLSRLE